MELDNIHTVALWSFLAASVFGIVAGKTQFCTMGSLSDWVMMGSKTRFRAWMLAIAVAVLGSQLLQSMGLVNFSETFYLSTNFGWLGYIVGGILFGIGMTLGAGCGQRTLVRVGGGNLKSLMVLLVLAITAYATLRGILALIRINWIQVVNVDLSTHGFADQSIPSLLGLITGIDRNTLSIVVAFLVGAGLLFFVFKDKEFRESADNILAGVTVGLLVVWAWYTTGVIGYDEFEPVPLEALTFIAPSGNTLNYLMTYTGSVISFGVAMVLGMIFGSFVYAIASGTFRIETFSNRNDMLNHFYAGVLMGFGGVLSLGCTIGQGVSGMSTLALGSVVTLFSIIAGSVATLKIQYYLYDDQGWSGAFRSTLADFRLLSQRSE